MNNENVDRLFREHAEKYEVKPGATAWDTIHGQIGTKTSVWPTVWKVAAVLVVLLSSVIVLFRGQESSTITWSGIADYPQLTEAAVDWELPQVATMVDRTDVRAISKPVKTSVPTVKERVQVVASPNERPYLELQSISIAWEITIPDKPELYIVPVEEISIKIRYYASEPEPVKTKKSLGHFLARAQQKLNPDGLLADLRTAKDDLFRSNKGD